MRAHKVTYGTLSKIEDDRIATLRDEILMRFKCQITDALADYSVRVQELFDIHGKHIRYLEVTTNPECTDSTLSQMKAKVLNINEFRIDSIPNLQHGFGVTINDAKVEKFKKYNKRGIKCKSSR